MTIVFIDLCAQCQLCPLIIAHQPLSIVLINNSGHGTSCSSTIVLINQSFNDKLTDLHLGHILSVTMLKIFAHELELRLSVNHATRKVKVELAHLH